MRKRVAALRFLIDRHVAGRFVELTGSQKPATVGRHLLEKIGGGDGQADQAADQTGRRRPSGQTDVCFPATPQASSAQLSV
ncbi:MAG: hypothetical protein M5U25_13485 [Planctomycetota bacterium]|nr:hypothetical protein [Planctomycetota bacterium]